MVLMLVLVVLILFLVLVLVLEVLNHSKLFVGGDADAGARGLGGGVDGHTIINNFITIPDHNNFGPALIIMDHS